jgi:hypothetical protein
MARNDRFDIGDNAVLTEHVDTEYKPTEKEIEEYAEWLGMDAEKDSDLLYIAEAGLKAALPANWRACQTDADGEIFYFNFETGVSTWDHPLDEVYRKKYHRALKKREKENGLVATLHAEMQGSGLVSISIASMSGDELVALEVEYAVETMHNFQRKVAKSIGQPLRLLLPNGELLRKRVPLRVTVGELLGLPVQDTAVLEAVVKPPQPAATSSRAAPAELPPLKGLKKPRKFGTIPPLCSGLRFTAAQPPAGFGPTLSACYMDLNTKM